MRGNFSPARNVRSTTEPESSDFTFVRTNAPPLPGFTCWNSTMRQTPPSSSMCMPFRNSFVETVSATAQNLPNGRILGAMATGTWEGVAAEWARHVRSGGDAPFEWNFPAFCTLLPEPAELAIDCGCGEGRASRALRAQGHRVTGGDSSATLVRLARQADTDGDYR